MNELLTNSCPVNGLFRCEHLSPAGRRCRQSVSDPTAVLCSFHIHIRQRRRQASSQDLSAELTAGLDDFKSAHAVNDFLSRLLVLQARGEITPRRAAVMAYTCNLLLRTLPAIDRELGSDPDAPVEIIWDVPGVPLHPEDSSKPSPEVPVKSS